MVLDVFPLRRVGGPSTWFGPAARAVWAEKLGFGLLGLLTIPMAYVARGEDVTAFWLGGYDPAIAITWGIYSLGFYVWKTLAPGNLSPVYPMPEGEAPMVASVLLSLGLVLSVTAGVIAIRRRWAAPMTAWIVYILLISPLSGILPLGRLRGVADRYSYVACIGGAIVAGGAVTLGWRQFRSGDLRRLWAAAAAVGILAVLVGWSVLSWQQTKVWRNGITLWGWAANIHGKSPVVHNNLGWAWARAGEYERAEVHARLATEILPNSATALQTLGRILAAQGRFEESAEVLRRAVELAPRWAEGRIGFGSVLYETGDARQAVDELQRAIQLDPVEARAHYYLGQVLLREGRRDEAEPHLARAMELQRGLRPVPVEEAVGKTGAWPALLPEPEAGGFRPRRRRGPPACRSGPRRSDEPAA
jgi:Tfp pilus assembly protein PilF